MRRKHLWLTAVNAWFLAYAGWEGFVVTQWHQFYWWLPVLWALICLTWLFCNRAIVRSWRTRGLTDRTERCLRAEPIAHDTWLADSASWPVPWAQHDLDYPESKVSPWR